MTADIPDGFPVTLPKHALAGLDGTEDAAEANDERGSERPPDRPLTLSPRASDRLRAEIARAGGREVCFLAEVDENRQIHSPRAVARGNFAAVLVAAKDARQGGVMLHNHPSGVLEPSNADLNVAAQLYEDGLGTAIVDNDGKRLYVVVEPPAPKETVLLDPAALEAVLAPSGAMAERTPTYEDRPGQRAMLRAIVERFNEGGVEIVEAGTGTGKSLAYLLPAVRWAQENRERTILSTNTINLQEQLAGKDVPLVESLLGEVTWALVKGRGNYVSIRRARLAAESQASIFPDDRSEEIRSILEWIQATEDGSLSDLAFSPASDTWEEIRSDSDICLRARCPHFQACFYQNARRKAASADVLVVNHHLLFTDLAVRRATSNYKHSAVLPAYQRVVLDEAHNAEDAATSHLGVEITRSGLFRALSRLDRRGRGILTAVYDAADGMQGSAEIRQRVENAVRPALSKARAEIEGLVERLEPYLNESGSAVRLGEAGVEPVEREEVAERLRATLTAFGTLERKLADLRTRVEIEEGLSEKLQARLLDLRSVERRLASSAHGLRLVLAPGDDARWYVRWLEGRGSGSRMNLVLAAAPIELGEVLRESLFNQVETTVLTSATLTTRGTFDFLRGRLGLMPSEIQHDENPVEVHERIVQSPFDFTNQVVLGVVTDLPGFTAENHAFDRGSTDVLADFAELTDGGLFGLFTSYAALRRVATGLREAGIDGRWPLFVQGESDRYRLLERFVDSGRGILLGTSSFWEGVDVPGDPLRGLLIQKLPFRVPSEPITAARMEALERRGHDPFQHFMLPHAALRLKQGFGRLIRSQTDRGAVVLLDDRILTKRYGRYLRGSLPDAPLVKGTWTDVRRRLEDFYGGVG